MYDAETAALIARAPPLEGLKLEDLPQRLTNAYASIVANRVRLRALVGSEVFPDDLKALIDEIERLAFTNEALVSAAPSRNDRAAAAFVAASAHHLKQLAKQMGGPNEKSAVAIDHVSPDVSATLLFLIAEAAADANELARMIVTENDDPFQAVVLTGIRLLATGRLEALRELAPPANNQTDTTPNRSDGHRELLRIVLAGLRSLGQDLLSTSPDQRGQRAVEAFERVKALSFEMIDDQDLGTPLVDTYPGAFHLASLLSSAASDLASSALTKLPPPRGVDGGRWGNLLREIAKRRPYIWRNHRQAIADGYLERGTSSVVSFPTGAGKSTLAELKIAVALLRGEKVIFLVPTLALVDQTAKALKATFRTAEVQREKWEALTFDDLLMEGLPEISVMTPERCLAMLAFDRSVFEGVGLLVFDECHIIHPADSTRSRRALDAMLCLLNFVSISPEADLLLLSAMMRNAPELAAWVGNLTERKCVSLNLTWKPTRQVRGCVIYDAKETQPLRTKITASHRKAKTKSPGAALKREAVAHPYGLFCLHQTWQSKARKDYALIPLLDSTVSLGVSGIRGSGWYLTPNGNHVAAKLGVATANLRLKTLVFVQNIRSCDSVAQTLSDEIGAREIPLTEEEARLWEAAAAELGDASHLYVKVKGGRLLESACLPHHGLLLSPERQLHESIFRRADGIDVLIATSTLAQGMNLPSEVVLICGDSRFEPTANKLEKLQAHELLNAAGRAGRAGEDSHGFVLIVPSKVVDFEPATNKIDKYWMDVQAIFSQSDQCLDIEDPIEPLLDHIHLQSDQQNVLVEYLITRLPRGVSEDADRDAHAKKFLSNTFAAYRAKSRGDTAWVDQRITAALKLRAAYLEKTTHVPWADRLSASVGFPSPIIRALGEELKDVQVFDPRDVAFWCAWLRAWLSRNPENIPGVIRSENLEGLIGSAYDALHTDAERGRCALPVIDPLLQIWMRGGSLAEMEIATGVPADRVGKCKKARQFVLRVVPDLGYLFSLPLQVLQARSEESAEEVMPGLGLSTLGACVREGFDKAEKLALRQLMKGGQSRVLIHRHFAKIEPFLASPAAVEDLGMAVERVKAALAAATNA